MYVCITTLSDIYMSMYIVYIYVYGMYIVYIYVYVMYMCICVILIYWLNFDTLQVNINDVV